MTKTIAALCACVVVASPAAAGPMVTWVATGEVTESRIDGGFPTPIPPIGTPISLTITFAPSDARPTFTFGSPIPGCMYVDVSATMNLGGYAWGGQGFAVTHGMLPDSLCNPRLQSTQFSLGLVPKEDIPWDSDHPFALNPPTTFILQYSDQLVRDAFPDVPTTSGHAFNALLWTPFNAAWNIDAFLHLSAADQSAPVPEPGTIMLLGLGLAAAARARRKNKQK